MREENPFADMAPAELPVISDAEAAGRAKRLASSSAAFFGGVGGAITGLVLNLMGESKGWKRPAIFTAAGAALGLILTNLTWHIKPKRDNTQSPESDVLIPHPAPALPLSEPSSPTPHPTVQLATAELEASRKQAEAQTSPSLGV